MDDSRCPPPLSIGALRYMGSGLLRVSCQLFRDRGSIFGKQESYAPLTRNPSIFPPLLSPRRPESACRRPGSHFGRWARSLVGADLKSAAPSIIDLGPKRLFSVTESVLLSARFGPRICSQVAEVASLGAVSKDGSKMAALAKEVAAICYTH